MRSSPPFRLTTTLICDQVRREDNGKYLVIGVYSGDVLVEAFPAKIAVVAYIEGESFNTGEYNVRVRMRLQQTGLKEFVQVMDGPLEIGKNHSEITLTTPPIILEVEQRALLTLDYSIDGARWKPLKKKVIKRKTG